jgi:AcrR family transcriptional regulator
MSGTQTGGRGPYRTGVRRREQLIAVAIDVFAEHGFAGGSIRAIADKAGVSHATLIQHFGSKEGLLTAVLEEWDRRTVENGLADVSGLNY